MEKTNSNEIELCLKDAGCQKQMIDEYIESIEHHDLNKQLLLLKKQKCLLLEKLHENQKQIDCLDYLIYTIKKEQKK